MEKIVCSAIYINDGVARDRVANLHEGFVICGRRHSDCYSTLKILGVLDQFKHLLTDNSSGFITTENRFVDRSEAYKIALNANTIYFHYANKGSIY